MKLSVTNAIFTIHFIIITSKSKELLKKLHAINILHWCLFTILLFLVSFKFAQLAQLIQFDLDLI